MRIWAVLAVTPDGKIAPPHQEHYVRLTSQADMEHLRLLRDEADAVLMGAATWRAFPKVHRGTRSQRIPLHVILTRSWRLPLAPLANVTTFICSSQPPPMALPPRVTYQPLTAEDEISQVHQLIHFLHQKGIRNLMVEGGGEILRLFLEAGRLQELFLTLAPRLIGNAQAPPLLPGRLINYPNGVELELLQMRQVGNELFLHYRIVYPPRPPQDEPHTGVA